MLINTASNRYAVSNIIVAPTLAQGAMFTSVQDALDYANANGITEVFFKPGTYVGNLNLYPNINLVAHNLSVNQQVIIKGKCSFSSAGIVNFSGIKLETDGDYAISVTGSADSKLQFNNCYLNCVDYTGIEYSSSSSNSSISFYNCYGDLGTSGITYYNATSAGILNFSKSNFLNSSSSTTQNTSSAGTLAYSYTNWQSAIVTSGTCKFVPYFSFFYSNANIIPVTVNGTSTPQGASFSYFFGGAQSGISLGAGSIFQMSNCAVDSSNANAIAGSGFLYLDCITFIGTSATIQSTITLGNRTSQFNSLNANFSITTPSITINSGTPLTNFVEGTFTPNLQFGSASTGITYTTQIGKYQRIGSKVSILIDIHLSNKGTATGNATISNLPFVSANDGTSSNLFMYLVSVNTTSKTYFTGGIAPNVNVINLTQVDAITGTAALLQDSNFINTSYIRIEGFYFI